MSDAIIGMFGFLAGALALSAAGLLLMLSGVMFVYGVLGLWGALVHDQHTDN